VSLVLRLHAAEQEIVVAEAEHFAARANNPAYAELRDAAGRGELGEDLVPVLGQILELGLATGRIRGAYGPHGEMTARTIFRRTPRGRELSKQVTDVNEALEALDGRTIEGVSVSAPAPGAFILTLDAGGTKIVLNFDRAGPSVKSLEVSL
jgi:hypothetical protein